METNYAQKKRLYFLLIPCLMVSVFACIYTFGQGKLLNITVLNVICLPFLFLQLAIGLIESNNKRKTIFFFSATFISAIIEGLNLWSFYQPTGSIWSEILSGWNLLWAILLLISVSSTVVIAIRLIRWSQDQWEIVKRMREEGRMEMIAFLRQYFSNQNSHRLNMQKKKQLHQQKLKEQKQEFESTAQNIREKAQQEKLLFKIAQDKLKQDAVLSSMNNTAPQSQSPNERCRYIKKLEFFFNKGIVVIFIGGFIFLPLVENLGPNISKWIDAVFEISTILTRGTIVSKRQALIYYILFYIVTYSFVCLIIYLLLHIGKPKNNGAGNNRANFLKEYQYPVALLIVFGAFLYILTNGKADFPHISTYWQLLLLVILFILVLFTAVEIVRIFIVQCTEDNSILRKSIYILFVSIIRLLSELTLGVVINLHIQMVISSLFSLFFPELDESEKSFSIRSQKELEDLFCNALTGLNNGKATTSRSPKFHQQNIWRKH